MNIIKKIVAIATVSSLAFGLASPAAAITAAELQAQIDALLAQLAALQSQLSGLEGGGTGTVTGCTITSFTRNLSQGMSGDDVKCLQIVLNSSADTQVAASGVGSSGSETNYFGPLTKAAVIKFQEKYASEVLASWGLTSGTGFVGSTTRTKLDSLLAGGVGPGGEVGTAATVSLAADTPAASQVALSAQDIPFTKVKFTAGATAYTITQLVVSRGGVSADADVASIKIYDGSTQLGSTQALNTTTHKATFTGLSWEIPAYGVKYLTIKASIAATNVATVGDSIRLNINVSSDITATAAPSGTFPIQGNAMTIAGISVGGLNVDVQTTPATNTNMLSGAVNQEIACWRFSASSTESFNVHTIRISQVGTASRNDFSNITLKVSGAQIGSPVAQVDLSNYATFDLSSSPLGINAGAAKIVCAYADIAPGIWTSRTVRFEITQYTDVSAYGGNTGGLTTITWNSGNTFVKQRGNTMTIGQGTLTIALDAAQNPSVQNYVKGTTNKLITALKFSTASTEGARVVKIVLTLGGTGSATDLSNITLWDGDTMIAGPASVIGTTVTFGANTVGWDTSALFDVQPSQTKTILVKADIPAGATAANTVSLSIAAASDVRADGLNSRYDLPTSSISGTATGNAHVVTAYGALAVSLASDTPAAQTYVKGSTAKVFTKVNLTAASGEDIAVTAITVRCFRGTTGDNGTSCSSGDVSNVKLLKSDGSQFGATVASPSASASFSGSMIVSSASTEPVQIVSDIPTTSNATSVQFSIVSGTVSTDLTSTGADSSADIVETGSATGNLMTTGSGSLTIAAAPTPADQTLIIGASEVPLVSLVMTAGTGEDIRVTKVMLRRSCLTGNSCASTDVSNIALYEGDTRLTAKKGWDTTNSTNTTFAASDFLNSTGIDIVKGAQKTIIAKADLPSTASNGNVFGLGIATTTDPSSSTTTDVTIVGLSSNTTPEPTVTKASSDLEGANYSSTGNAGVYYATLATAGVLTIDTNADTPVETIQSVSIEGIQIPNVAFHKSYFKATLEEVDIKSISVTRLNGRDSDFASVSLWDGDTQLGTSQQLVNGSTTFSFAPADYWRIPTVGAKYLTIKATLNGIRTAYGYGSETGDAPKLGVDTVTAEGVASGQSPTGAGVKDKLGNTQIIRQSQPTLALAAPTSGSYGAGSLELIRFTVSADATGDVGWMKVIFDISGSVTVSTAAHTIGVYMSGTAGACDGVTSQSGIYMSTSTTCGEAVAKQLIATSSLQLWDANTNTQVTATTTGTAWTVDQSTATGTARVAFVAAAEQVVGSGSSKTYYVLGNSLYGGAAGDSLLTKIASRSTATSTVSDYYYTADTAGGTFVWTDRSGALGSHSTQSEDWTGEYKIQGIPTASKTLSK
jgi:hypothetical protein